MVVLGAGVTGLTCGALLAEAGADVIVIEALHVGAGTMGAPLTK
ncbi:MAG: NAD(P)-binding protein [Nitriliruptorales bacterium]